MRGVRYRAVNFAYPNGRPALTDVDLAIEPGEVVLLAGSSGSGKSTLLRCANGLVPHASGGSFSGDVTVGDRSTRTHRPRDFADSVGFVHQDPEAQFVVDRVEGDVAFVLENLGVDPTAMRRRVEEVLDALAIAHLRDRSPGTLSGGERQRCALAGALAAGPEVLVLDEPTSELDPQGADDVLTAVQRLNLDLGTTVVMAEHRLERAAHLADRALITDDGTIGVDGLPAEVLVDYAGAPPVTHLGRLLGWDPLPLTVREARAAARRQPVDLPDPPSIPGRATGDVLLSGSDVTVRYRGLTALASASLDVREGEVWAILGRNGSGKTTLLRALAGLVQPDGGRVQAHRSVAYVPQDPNSLLFSPTVRGELAGTLKLRGLRDSGQIDQWLERLRLEELADRHPRSLSAGERQRVAVAAIAVGAPDVLVLDEPTRGIDALSRDALEAAIVEHAAAGGAVVVSTHDVELAARVADSVLVLSQGEIVASGPARHVLSGSLFAPQVLRVLPPFLTVAEVRTALRTSRPTVDRPLS